MSRCASILIALSLIATSNGAEPVKQRPSSNEQPATTKEAKQPGDAAKAREPALFLSDEVTPAVAKINSELNWNTIVEFVQTPLQDVVEYLKDYHHMEIQLNKKALAMLALTRRRKSLATCERSRCATLWI